MQEVICAHIGQAGIQISNAAWELFCVEHGIEANGLLKNSLTYDDSDAFKTFFYEAPNSQFVPRSISVDLEPTVIDEIRTGAYRNLFHPDQLLNVFDDGSNNFARAHFTIGKQFIDQPINVIRKIAENCDGLQGFILIHSHAGGTGSGFTSLILEGLSTEYPKSLRFQFSIYPSAILSSAVVEPYNAILLAQYEIENSDVTSLINNEAVFGICKDMLSVSRPTFSNINRVISQSFSDLTVSLRFESTLCSNLQQMVTNLIPYPRIHFPILSHAPLISESKADHDSMTTNQITRSVFSSKNKLITCDLSTGLFMCCILQYRGDIVAKDVNEAIFGIKKRQDIRFVDWCPTGFKLGINSQPTIKVPSSEMAQSSRSITMISNTTSIKDPMEVISEKFDILLKKRSFVHWFVGEGMEEGEFIEARENKENLILDFVELSAVEEEDQSITQPVGKESSGTDKQLNVKESFVIKSISRNETAVSNETPTLKKSSKSSTKLSSSAKSSENSDEDEDEEDDEEEDEEEGEEGDEEEEEEEEEGDSEFSDYTES